MKDLKFDSIEELMQYVDEEAHKRIKEETN
jgi:hypothetical protein